MDRSVDASTALKKPSEQVENSTQHMGLIRLPRSSREIVYEMRSRRSEVDTSEGL